MRIEIRLDGRPRGKGVGRAMAMSGGFGQPPHARIYTDERTRKYEAQLRYAAQQVMAGRPPIAEPVVVTIEARFQIPVSFSKRKRAEARMGLIFPAVKPDWDNFAKSCDGLNGVVWVDDKQIVDGRVVKIYAEHPGLSIVVETKFSGELQPALPLVTPLNSPTRLLEEAEGRLFDARFGPTREI